MVRFIIGLIFGFTLGAVSCTPAEADTRVTLELGAAFGADRIAPAAGARIRHNGAETHFYRNNTFTAVGFGVVGSRTGSQGGADVGVGGAYVQGAGVVPYGRVGGYSGGSSTVLGASATVYGSGDTVLAIGAISGTDPIGSRAASQSLPPSGTEVPPVVTPPPVNDDACKPGHGHGDRNHCHSGPPGRDK